MAGSISIARTFIAIAVIGLILFLSLASFTSVAVILGFILYVAMLVLIFYYRSNKHP